MNRELRKDILRSVLMAAGIDSLGCRFMPEKFLDDVERQSEGLSLSRTRNLAIRLALTQIYGQESEHFADHAIQSLLNMEFI